MAHPNLSYVIAETWARVQRERDMRIKAQRKAEQYRQQVLVRLQSVKGLPHPSGWRPEYRDYRPLDYYDFKHFR